jgi:hypothetical protein
MHCEPAVIRHERERRDVTREQCGRAETAGMVERGHRGGRRDPGRDANTDVERRGDHGRESALLDHPQCGPHPAERGRLDDHEVGGVEVAYLAHPVMVVAGVALAAAAGTSTPVTTSPCGSANDTTTPPSTAIDADRSPPTDSTNRVTTATAPPGGVTSTHAGLSPPPVYRRTVVAVHNS